MFQEERSIQKGETALLATSTFIVVNNSFTVTLLAKMHEIACFATYNFKIFPGSMRPDPLWLACPLLGESGLTLIYAARYALFDA